ncbi:MAG: hypothetical protein ACXWPM_08175 [Bdellovibrionota bacterium]
MKKSAWLSAAALSILFLLHGKVDSVTDTHYLIQDGDTVYYVQKRAMTGAQKKQLESAGTKDVSIQVSAEAIDLVKRK